MGGSIRIITAFAELDQGVVRDLLEEAEEGDLVGSQPREGVVGVDLLHHDRRRRESRQHQPLPKVAAPPQPHVRRLPHPYLSLSISAAVLVKP